MHFYSWLIWQFNETTKWVQFWVDICRAWGWGGDEVYYLESGPQTSVLYTDRSASYYEAETAQQTLSSTKNRKIMKNYKSLKIQVQIYGAFLKKIMFIFNSVA